MKEYKCENCKKIFDRKSNYMNHLNRKNACDSLVIADKIMEKVKNNDIIESNNKLKNIINIDNEYIQKCLDECKCAYCGHTYTRKSNVVNHIKFYCKKVKEIEKEGDLIFENLKRIEEEKLQLKLTEEKKFKLNLTKEEKLKLKDEKLKLKEEKFKLKEERLKLKEKRERDGKIMYDKETGRIKDKKTIEELKEQNKMILLMFNKLKQEFEKVINLKKDDKNISTNINICDVQNNQNEQSNSSIECVPKNLKNKRKKKIPPNFRILVWDKYIGLDKGKSLCLCCKKREISQMDFHCGHIISEADGGEIHIDNLLPICAMCDYSMWTENLLVHREKLEKFEKNQIDIPRYKVGEEKEDSLSDSDS
jgi:hypothetical protein